MGHFRLRVRKRGKHEKIWWLIAGCQATRYCKIVPLLNLTASAVLMALEQIWYELGCNTSYIIFSDFGSQIVPLITTIDDDDEQAMEVQQSQKLASDLKLLLQKKKIIYKPHPPKSQWRNSIIESLCKLSKQCMKRSQLKDKSFYIQEWYYITSRISYILNSRCLNLKYIQDEFKILSPNQMIFGSRSFIYPRRIEAQIDNLKLYEHMSKLDQQIKSYEFLWLNSYYHSVKENRNKLFKKYKQEIKPGSVVMVTDKINKSAQQPIIGIVTACLSERTCKILYISREAKIDSLSYKIEKVAKKKELLRPVQSLVWLCEQDCREEIPLDPYILDKVNTGVDHDDQDDQDSDLDGQDGQVAGVVEDLSGSDRQISGQSQFVRKPKKIKVTVPDENEISDIEMI